MVSSHPNRVLNPFTDSVADERADIIVANNPDSLTPCPSTFIHSALDSKIIWSDRHHGVMPIKVEVEWHASHRHDTSKMVSTQGLYFQRYMSATFGMGAIPKPDVPNLKAMGSSNRKTPLPQKYTCMPTPGPAA